MSGDGNHFALGLNDGSLVVKSKLLDEEDDGKNEEEKMYEAFMPKMKKTSKDYKYFYRGQYVLQADPEDLQAAIMSRTKKLQPCEKFLKKFEYRKALNSALSKENPEVTLALIEELVERGGVHIALANRSEEELLPLLQFLVWKISDHRYSAVLVNVARIVLDMYHGVLGLSKEVDKKLFVELEKAVTD